MSKESKKQKKAVTKKAVTKPAVKKTAKAAPYDLEEARKILDAAQPKKEVALTPEIMPKEEMAVLPTDIAQIVRYKCDEQVLNSIESSVRRDIQLASKVDKAGAMLAIKIGLALNEADRIIATGFFEAWMSQKFGDIFSTRRGYYYRKLAKKFQHTEQYKGLLLPEKGELGNWLAVSDEQSELGAAVSLFVGDMSINELMDRHGVKSKLKGGERVSDRDMEAFVRDYPELRGKPFETWADADKEQFRVWRSQQMNDQTDFHKRTTTEAFWSKTVVDLVSRGLGEKTWRICDDNILKNLYKALGDLHEELAVVLKGKV